MKSFGNTQAQDDTGYPSPLITKKHLGNSSATAYALFVLLTLFFTNIINLTHRLFIAIVSPSVQKDLNISDSQFGLLIGPFFNLVFIVAGLILAKIADHWHRKIILAFCTILWSISISLHGFATHFYHLLLCRAGVAIGQSVVDPIAFSLISDFFTFHSRGSAISFYATAPFIGLGISYGLGGLLKNKGATDWRFVHHFLGIPGIAIGLIIFIFVKEPRKGHSDHYTIPEDHKSFFWDSLKYIVKRWSFWCVCIAGSLRSYSFTGITTWISPFFWRVHDMPLADQAKWFSWSAALFGFIGVLSAGFISDHWSKKNIRGRIYMCITTSLAVIPFFTIAMLANHSSLISICVGVMPLFFVAQMWTGSAGAVVTNISPATIRTAISSIYFIVQVFFSGLSPMIIGFINDLWGNPMMIRYSLLINVVAPDLLAAGLFGLSLVWLHRDILAAEEFYYPLA